MTKKIIFIATFVWVCAVPQVFAAVIVFEAEPRSLEADGNFIVSAYLDTEGESVNAIEGSVLFSEGIVQAEDVRAGNSSVSVWIEAPRAEAGTGPFAGIIPGGLTGSKHFLFSIVFRGQSAGLALVEGNLKRVLKNDGAGTEVPVRQSYFSFAVVPSSSAPSAYGDDVSPPNLFTVAFGRDEALFDGKYFAAFLAQDKESGISYYEVREDGYAPVLGISPYLLQNQNADKKMSVTAFDRAGNARTVIAYPPQWLPWYRRYGAALAGAVFVAVFLLVRFRGRISKKHN